MMRVFWRSAFVIAAGAIIWLSLLPSIGQVGVSDKSLHLFAYCVLTAIGLFGWTSLPASLAVVALAIAQGGALELAQALWVPGRYGELADFAANTAGSLLALLAVFILRRLWQRRAPPHPDRPH